MRRKVSRSRVPGWIRFFNPLARSLMAAGMPMGPDVLLTVRGRRTGLPRSTPVAIAEIAGREWLLSPFGDVDWARNLKAAGHATIRSGRRRYEIDATALGRENRIAFFRDVLEPYLLTHGTVVRWIVRTLDGIPDDPVAAADACDVFQVTRTA
jgi:deazaflavin-dependent oxidoreductase (nitroreductase family)